MPPQRRKIVPPTTTKARRPRVAGAAKSPETSTQDTLVEEKDAHESGVAEQGEHVGVRANGASTKSDSASKLDEAPTAVDLAKSPVAKADVASATDVETDTAADATADKLEPNRAAPTRGRSIFGWKYVSIVGAVAAILVIVAMVAWFKPGAKLDNTAWVDESTTSQVTAAASNAVQTLYSYKADTIDQDFNNARGVLTSSMLDEFNKTADTTKQAVVQTKTATQASVTDIGVTLLQGNNAELVINMNVSATTDGVAQGSAQGPLNVKMTRVDGKWLLSAIDDN